MKRILTGLQPTGVLQLGNYIGTISQLLELQKQNYEIFILVVNLHSMTLEYDVKELEKNTKTLIDLFWACGLNQENTHIVVQSDIEQHLYLQYILLCHSTLDELKKMTQFKDKVAKGIKQKNNTSYIPTGLLTYPILQAADILLYNPQIVPVGDDQKQHLELSRNLAQRLNNKYQTKIVVPEPLIKKSGSRIMSLANPMDKMSKSNPSKKATIFLLDDMKDIQKKINSAVTDSENKVYYDKENKPGVANLIEIYASLKKINIKQAEVILKDLDYKEFKQEVFLAIKEVLKPIQESYYNIDYKIRNEKLNKSLNHLRNIAEKNLNQIKAKVGLNYEK